MSMRHLVVFLFAGVTLGLLPGCAGGIHYPVPPRIDLLGMPVIDQAAVRSGASTNARTTMRTIVLTPTTRWIDVTSGETVRFVTGEQAFAWQFQVSPNVATFALNQVAPPGWLSHTILVYVAPNPLYGAGG